MDGLNGYQMPLLGDDLVSLGFRQRRKLLGHLGQNRFYRRVLLIGAFDHFGQRGDQIKARPFVQRRNLARRRLHNREWIVGENGVAGDLFLKQSLIGPVGRPVRKGRRS